jgi:hypothetical protein
MSRCYFVKSGRILWGDDLAVSTLADAIELGDNLRRAFFKSGKSPGLEIWREASLLYQDVYDVDQMHGCAPIISPSATLESAIYAMWRPSQVRPWIAQVRGLPASQANHTIALRLFDQIGVAVLIWPMHRSQPTATVFTSNGTFSTLLVGVPKGLRELISLGIYRAQYSSGYVTILL